MFKRFQTPYYSNISAKFMLKAFDYGILCFPSGDSFFCCFSRSVAHSFSTTSDISTSICAAYLSVMASQCLITRME